MRDRERVQKMQPQEYTETLSTMVGIVKDAWKELSDLAMKPCRWTGDHEVTRIKVIFLAASIDTLLYDFTNFIADCEKVCLKAILSQEQKKSSSTVLLPSVSHLRS